MVDLQELVYMCSQHIGDGTALVRDALHEVYVEFCRLVPDKGKQKKFREFLLEAQR